MKKKAIALLVSLLMLLGMAQAQGTLTAELAEGGMQVCWSGCTGDATLTVYRDGWPILVESVGAGEGQYWVPGGYINRPGTYSVRLSAGNCCLTATALGAIDADTGEPSPVPTQAPVWTASPDPTQEPVQTASPTPTQPPARTALPEPTQEPAQTSAPQQTPIPTRVPETTPQPTQSEGNTLSALASKVIAQTNEERTSRGLNALTADAELNRAAAVRARGNRGILQPYPARWIQLVDREFLGKRREYRQRPFDRESRDGGLDEFRGASRQYPARGIYPHRRLCL